MSNEKPRRVTPGGSQVIKEYKVAKPYPSTGDYSLIEAVDDHIFKYVGKVAGVFHEEKSEFIHLDVHYVPPSEDGPWFHTLITSGMSELPMTVDPGGEKYRYAELVITYPAKKGDDFLGRAQQNRSPESELVHLIKYLARYPHQYQGWFSHRHTIVLPQDVQKKFGFDSVLFERGMYFPSEFSTLKFKRKLIHFLSIWFLYKEELDFKLNEGTKELMKEFDEQNITEIVRRGRRNVITKQTKDIPIV